MIHAVRMGRLACVIALLSTLVVGAGALAAEKTPIEFWFGETNQTYIDAMSQIVAQFNESHPTLQVTMKTWDANDVDKLTTAMTAGTPPDVAYMAGFTVNIFKLHPGYLRPLNDLMDSATVQGLDVLPGPALENSRLGIWYAIPFRTTSSGLFSNISFLEAAGYDAAAAPHNIAELDAMAAKLTRKTSEGEITQLGFAPQGNNFANGLPWLWAFGGGFYDPVANRPTFTNNAQNLAALNWIASYATQYGPGASSGSTAFINGSTAMHLNTSTYVDRLVTEAPELKWKVSPLPTVPEVEPFSIGFSLAAAIPMGAKHPQGAAEFILYLARPETQVGFYEKTQALPANLQAVRTILHEVTDPNQVTLIDLLQSSRATPPFYYPELYTLWGNDLKKMRSQTITPLQVLDDAQRSMAPIYEKAESTG